MRQGQNPAKMGLPSYQPKKLGLALLSYVPAQNGYFSQALEILKYQIASIHHATTDFDLLLFDNGSSPEVQQELRNLQADGLVHFLILSKFNLGKTGALNWILAGMPNEMIGFADGDVLFRPGWWEETERIFTTFPEAGLVTAQPCLFDILRGKGQAQVALASDPRYQCFDGALAPETVNEYARGTGLSAVQTEDLIQKPVGFIKDRSRGVQAVIGASHMQFVVRRETTRSLQPLPAEHALNREEDATLNRRIDQMNLLQLSTLTPLVYHMGNRLDEQTLAEIQLLGLDSILKQPHSSLSSKEPIPSKPAKRLGFRLIAALSKWPILGRMFQRSYNFLFEFYSLKK